MQRTIATIAASVMLLTATASADPLEETFLRPTPQARELLGPLFWLHGDESPERLREYVDIVAEAGNGCLTAESRPHVDWLDEGWYRDLAICLEQAKKHDMKFWIFDEKWWPSGEVGGKVPQRYASKYLAVEVVEATGPATVARPFTDQHITALLGRYNEEGILGDSLREPVTRVGGGERRWEIPEGAWKLMVFSFDYGKFRGGAHWLVDGASQEAVDWYINTVYQPHYDRFSDDFGEAIQGYFYDEPETLGDWGTEVFPLLKERGVDWKKALVAWKVGLAGEEQVAAKYAYQDAYAEAWGRTMYGGISDWCAAHDVSSIGHWLEHSWEYLRPDRCAGNMFQVMKYTDLGGIDAVFKQFVWGERDMGLFYTPKLGSSITHAYGKQDDLSMVEIYGARGQDISYPEMKWWLDHMQVSGINFIIPHSFNPRAPFDRDCPPYFYNGGYEPRYPLYRVWADYSVRLSHMLSGGRHVCPVAFLYLGNSYHVGESITPEQMTGALQDALFDCDWIPYDVMEADMRIEENTLALRDERYRVLVVPPVEVIPPVILERARDFYEAGGVVVGYGFLPTRSATLGRGDQSVVDLSQAIWGGAPAPALTPARTNAEGGRAYLLPKEPTPESVWQALAEDANVRPTLEVLSGDTDHWLHVLHRVKDGRDVFFITNQNIDGGARTYRIKARAQGVPECWDPMRAESRSLEYETNADGVVFELVLEENEGVLVVFRDEKRELPLRGDLTGCPSVTVTREASPPSTAPDVNALLQGEEADPIRDASWIWHAADGAVPPPGTRYLRKTLVIPAGVAVEDARFKLAADNEFALFVNGKDVVSGTQWNAPENVNIASLLTSGENQIAIRAYNGAETPNPAGVIGGLVVQLDNGETFTLVTDASWKTATEAPAGWQDTAFDDAGWDAAKVLGGFGMAPWGDINSAGLTLPPVLTADPFHGTVSVPDEWLASGRIHLVTGPMQPEEGARVTVNGVYAGGFISKPYRLDVTDQMQSGVSNVVVEPFAPESVELVWEAL